MEYLSAHQNPSKPNLQGQGSTIPSSWELTTLEKVCVGPPQNGAFIKDARFGSGTLYVNVYDIYQNAVLMPGHVQRVKWDDAAKERYLLKNGDLLFVRSSLKREGVGHCCLVTNLNEPAIFDCHLIRVSPDTSTVEPLYLTYFCLAATQRRDLIARSKTTTMTTMNQNMLMQTPIVLPPMPQQQAIVRALAAVQNAKEKLERELVFERECKNALMEQFFTHGTHGEPTKRTEIGEVPESWRILAFADAVEIKSGQVDPRNEPFASMRHVGPDNIESQTGRLLPTKTAKELKLISGKYLFTNQDVLYSKIRPYLKKAALPHSTGVCSADMYPLRPKDIVILREFLFHYLLTERFTQRAMRVVGMSGTAQLSEYIFHRDGAPVREFNKSWATATKAAKCEELLFHDLRRTCARRLLAAGVPTQIAKSITGHETDSIFSRYAIVDAALMLAAQEKVAAKFPRQAKG